MRIVDILGDLHFARGRIILYDDNRTLISQACLGPDSVSTLVTIWKSNYIFWQVMHSHIKSIWFCFKSRFLFRRLIHLESRIAFGNTVNQSISFLWLKRIYQNRIYWFKNLSINAFRVFNHFVHPFYSAFKYFPDTFLPHLSFP